MLKILAIAPHSPYQQDFKNFLHGLEGVDIAVANNIDTAKSQIFYSKPDILLVHISQITERSLQGIEQIRSPFDLPVIVFTNKLNDRCLDLKKRFPKYYMLSRPFLSRDVLGIAWKMIQGEVPEQQVQRRYSTNQNTVLQVVGTDSNISARITNLSLSGAKIHFDDKPAWKTGELIKMEVALDALNKTHSVHAKVIWIEKEPGTKEMGVEFIPTEEVYSHLLSNV